jgi:hypothetical protein
MAVGIDRSSKIFDAERAERGESPSDVVMLDGLPATRLRRGDVIGAIVDEHRRRRL